MPDKIDLTNVTGMKYEPNMSSCWTGSGTIVIQSNHQVQTLLEEAIDLKIGSVTCASC